MLKRIFTLKLADELVKRGNEIVDYEINTKNPKLKVFIFEDNERLQKDISEINNTA